MSKTEKQIRLCMRSLHRLVRRWYDEQGITRGDWPYDDIKQYGSCTVGFNDRPVCRLTLKPTGASFIYWDEGSNVI